MGEGSAGASGAALLPGRVALVTGASRGIGAATATLLGRHGAAVAVNYRGNRGAAEQVVAAIEAGGGQAVAVQGDVGDQEQVAAMVAEVADVLGPIDILVLNADAVRSFTVAPFVAMSWEQFEDLVLGETKAIFLPAQAVVPSMIERGRGVIVAISSGLSRTSRPGLLAHSAGKSAVDSMVRSLATELGPSGIRVNAVAPGLVETEASASMWQARSGRPGGQGGGATDGSEPGAVLRQMTPMRRIATADDVAGAVLMLAGDAAGFVTGVYLPVNGGLTML